ncbi:MAG: tRNA uridine-5-carboxymethylaminomethyl(34) synthesis GTPase MnmE [Alphaproteobacteria bacterium]|nr:tRNA uridine-5-carboxymethylaminomethyl(34) synthesis GTPase MnmE [Alphaproteobacteria bacterium]
MSAFAAPTIFALSSGAGRAGVAVVRISGPAALKTVKALTGKEFSPRRAALCRLVDPRDGTLLDVGLVLYFPAPVSFTGDEVVELHLHGSPAVVAAVAGALAGQGLAPAEAGAFTRRAFENGKLDLTEVEGLADLLAAETEAQRRQAVRQMTGELSGLYEGWRSDLVAALAHLEASIDFADEELPSDILSPVWEKARALGREIGAHLDDKGRGERLRAGLSLVLLGPPNAGKSSLLNRLARRDAAIVSHEAGTTRDIVEVQLDLGGVPASLADTAGLRAAGGEIEAEGVRRARARGAEADLRLVVLAPDAKDLSPLAELKEGDLVLLNKADLLDTATLAEFATEVAAAAPGARALFVSALTGAGIDALEAALAARAGELAGLTEAPALTRARHRHALAEARAHLDAALVQAAGPAELAAEELRLAARALARLVGRIDVEELLDVIFADFCIGK